MLARLMSWQQAKHGRLYSSIFERLCVRITSLRGKCIGPDWRGEGLERKGMTSAEYFGEAEIRQN